MSSLIDSILAARRCGTPLLSVSTPDQPEFTKAAAAEVGPVPAVQWDRAEGFRAINDEGAQALADLPIGQEELAVTSPDPLQAMRLSLKLKKRSVVFAHNLQRFFREDSPGPTIQAVSNLRDPFKTDGRTLVMMAPDVDLPTELRHDVVTLDDPLPEDDGYAKIVRDIYDSFAKNKKSETTANEDTVTSAVSAVRGLSSFRADQVVAMSFDLKAGRLDLDALWQHKVAAVSQTPGLAMTRTGPPLADLRGLDSVVAMLQDLFTGPMRPNLVVRVDEVDKAMSGLGSRGGPGDNTGVSQDIHSQFLTTMEDNSWTGAILFGVRGAGKTVLTQAIGAAYGVPTIAADLGAMKGGIVGESERNVRDAFRMIKSIGRDRVVVLATCNEMAMLRPEFLRRFKLGVWYFDLLEEDERRALWRVYLKRYGLDPKSDLPEDDGWTGAEIRNCCELSHALGKTPAQIGPKYIVPVGRSDANGISEMRRQAEGRYLSVSKSGPYRNAVDRVAGEAGRKFN